MIIENRYSKIYQRKKNKCGMSPGHVAMRRETKTSGDRKTVSRGRTVQCDANKWRKDVNRS